MKKMKQIYFQIHQDLDLVLMEKNVLLLLTIFLNKLLTFTYLLIIDIYYNLLLKAFIIYFLIDNGLFNEDHNYSLEKEEKESPWRQELLQQLDLNNEQKLVNNFQETKQQIQIKSLKLENIIDDIRTILTPTQCAKFLTCLERNKYRRDISNQNIWSSLQNNQSDYDFDDELFTSNQNQAQLQYEFSDLIEQSELQKIKKQNQQQTQKQEVQYSK
ncbi:hypothetical protein IMG5_168620 [Ichthyophthirius multifiliis]|uniref:Uncharacterized protein n=1 Tax=Ichthyophthirius multifiliis TaxID=5932 RepID=G0R159_ICHMU|nr:hypothetical protein IMG5_168620 [Ichthyophthirius multifiliis]EGR28826.1 hypothetical protein IMG5_168620 [Ichthyophthirius multifiliis]|eukprot:XP_004030062.1 hypothetical protein IMG5_168620 [Ichthyophthirius multifiliis]